MIEDNELQGILWEGETDGTVRIPDGVVFLGSWCLEADDSPCPPPVITEVTIPGSVRQIDSEALAGWTAMDIPRTIKTVRYLGTLREWCSIRKGWSDHFDMYTDFGPMDYELRLLDDEGNEYTAEELVFPADICEIEAASFAGCSSLRSAEIRGNAEIGAIAFQNCRNLHYVILSGDWISMSGDDRFEAGDQFPFDDRESLEIRLSDGAAESLLASELLDVEAVSTRYVLADREETLGEILEITDEIRDRYIYEYHLDRDISPVALFRIYLKASILTGAEESAWYIDREEPADTEPEWQMPEGFHEDVETCLKFSLRDRLRRAMQQLREYTAIVRDYVAFLSGAEDVSAIQDSDFPLPGLWDMIEEAEDTLDTYTWADEEDPEAQGNLESLIDQIEGYKDLLESIQNEEDELHEMYMTCRDPHWSEYNTYDPETFLQWYREDAEDLLAACAECEEYIIERL